MDVLLIAVILKLLPKAMNGSSIIGFSSPVDINFPIILFNISI